MDEEVLGDLLSMQHAKGRWMVEQVPGENTSRVDSAEEVVASAIMSARTLWKEFDNVLTYSATFPDTSES